MEYDSPKEDKPTNNWRSFASSVIGGAVAIAIAWQTIDWDNFELTRNNLMKLTLSGLVALGGYMTVIKGGRKK